MTTMNSELLCWAQHLAAHVVFAWRNRGWIGKNGIYLNPNGSGGVDLPACRIGSAAYSDPRKFRGFWEDRGDRSFREVLAGPVAEDLFRKRYKGPGALAGFYCGRSGNDEKHALEILTASVAATQSGNEMNSIDDIAAANDFVLTWERRLILRTLQSPGVSAAVQAVANALVENGGHLDGDAAFRLIEAQHPRCAIFDGYERIGNVSR